LKKTLVCSNKEVGRLRAILVLAAKNRKTHAVSVDDRKNPAELGHK